LKLARVLDTIEERAGHLRTFLEGYAKLAKLPQPRPREVEWAAFLRQIAELHPGVRLPSPPATAGWFDPVQIEQVVINLIKNAIEAGSRSEDIEVALDVDESGAVELNVSDRGPGFSEEALQNALLPLYTTKEHGSGMGLALCPEIVEAHGGSFGISNRVDGGATVLVRLPGRSRPDHGLTRSRVRLTLSRG
jgi:signal transduction histidine kinase